MARAVICSIALAAATTAARPVLGTGVPVAGPPQNAPPVQIHLTSGQRAAITKILTQTMASQRIPGMVVAVAVAGHPIYERALGERAPGKPVDIDTIFPIGSITKQFTAACVMWLSEKHRLDLDSAVSRYVVNVPHGTEVTVRELLDQTSGLYNYTDQPLVQRAAADLLSNAVSSTSLYSLNNVSSSQALALISNRPLKFRPGTQFDYSNTNYIAAGMVIEAVSGETYERFLRKHILVPLGLERTEYIHTSIPLGSDVARGYTISKNGREVLPRFSLAWTGSAGALASDVVDLVKWDAAFFHGRVVPPAIVRTMTTPVKSDYGYGWHTYQFAGTRVPWHNGGSPGLHAMNVYYPPADMEVVVLTNLMQSNPEGTAAQIIGVVLHPQQQSARTTSR